MRHVGLPTQTLNAVLAGVAKMRLTDAQWKQLEPLIPPLPRRADGRGRPWNDPREVLEGILWVLKSGARWRDLPRDEYPSYQTCHRWFQRWVRQGVLQEVRMALAGDLRHRGRVRLAEAFIDATFITAKKGATASARPSAAKAARSSR
jgi:transposase